MSQDLYKEKYVKYKSKYLSLKNVDGGARLASGRYFFYVPVSVFNTIVAHIYFTRLNKSIAISSSTKSSSATTTATTTVATAAGVISIEGPGSEVILNIIESNKNPSYQVQPGNSNFLNLKDQSNPLTLFTTSTRKFGIGPAPTTTVVKSSSKKPSDEVSESQIKTDLAILKNKADDNNKTLNNLEPYVFVHYQVNGLSKPNIFYATTDISTSAIHPMQTHLNAIKTAIENTRIDINSVKLF
jgi:hypothetical protein